MASDPRFAPGAGSEGQQAEDFRDSGEDIRARSRGGEPERPNSGRHASPVELLVSTARHRAGPAAIPGTPQPAPAAAPHLSRLSPIVDGRRALRIDVAGLVSLEDGDEAAVGPG